MASTNNNASFIPASWYRGVIHLLLLLLSICLIMLFIVGLAFIFRDVPEPKYFAVDNTGKVIELKPLAQALVEDNVLITWAKDAVTESLDYHWQNYRSRIGHNCALYFTKNGCDGYIEAQNKENINVVKDEKLLTFGMVTDIPVIKHKGVDGDSGLWTWVVEAPVVTRWESSSGIRKRAEIYQLTVVRDNTKPRGIGIEKINARPLHGSD